jgi:hypothetical protein
MAARGVCAVPSTGLDSSVNELTPIQAEYEGNWLDARVLAVEEGRILVHYNGWNKRFDEWFALDSPRVRHVPISNQVGRRSDSTAAPLALRWRGAVRPAVLLAWR